MTPDEYLSQVLAKYTVTSQAESYFTTLEPYLHYWASEHLSRMFISGSYAKGTAVKGGTDIDIFISMKPSYPDLSGMFESLYQFSITQGWFPRKQNVSVGIQYLGAKVDLVPARIQEGYHNWHSLFQSKKMSWTQTNVDLHIDLVGNSGRVNEIRALKIWRNIRNLEFPSFYLELMVLEALKYCPTNELSNNLLKALEYIEKNIITARVVDPSNTNNIISDDLSIAEKMAIAYAAHSSLQARNWVEIIK
jgi:predicted nucleotidyltransferase